MADCLTLETLGFMPEDLDQVEICHLLCEEPLVVRAAEAHLVRAITNLVRNALEAIDGPGKVNVTTRSVDLTSPLLGYEAVAPGSYAVVTVSDTGRGIDPAGLVRVFEPFFSSKRIRQTSGSGLGLAVVHGVLKEHDGYLDVASRLGQGTTFSLYFPRLQVALEASHKTSSLPRGRAKVLVVDDEPTQLRTASRVLGQLGYEIDTSRSGIAACRVFAACAAERPAIGGGRAAGASPYDLIIVDNVPQRGPRRTSRDRTSQGALSRPARIDCQRQCPARTRRGGRASGARIARQALHQRCTGARGRGRPDRAFLALRHERPSGDRRSRCCSGDRTQMRWLRYPPADLGGWLDYALQPQARLASQSQDGSLR